MNRFLKDLEKVCSVNLIEQDYRYDKKMDFKAWICKRICKRI